MNAQKLSVERVRTTPNSSHTLTLPLFVFLIWTIATYILEGRIDVMRQITGIGRLTYVVIANIVIGILGSALALRSLLATGVVTLDQLGFRSLRRSLVAVGLALAGGFATFALLNPPSLEPVVVLNIFAQVLPISIAEVVVCWALVGAGVEAQLRPRGRVLALVVALVAANVLFGVYHFAHSAPFNQLFMVIFLMIPGLVTSLVYFLGRDIYAAIIVQNCFGMIGVGRNIDLTSFGQPISQPLLLTLLALITLIGAHMLLRRLKP